MLGFVINTLFPSPVGSVFVPGFSLDLQIDLFSV